MAASFSCDGCGAPVDSPVKVGHVLKRDYCPTCEPIAQKFIADEEELRAATQAGFKTCRDVILAGAGAKLKLLPDVPDA